MGVPVVVVPAVVLVERQPAAVLSVSAALVVAARAVGALLAVQALGLQVARDRPETQLFRWLLGHPVRGVRLG